MHKVMIVVYFRALSQQLLGESD